MTRANDFRDGGTVAMSIDRDGKLPIYHQVALSLQRRIARQEWKVGDKLPSEYDLADAYEVSRVTVRQALTELEKEGIVVRKRPSGTFVETIPKTLSPTVGVMVDITTSLHNAGHDTDIQTVGIEESHDVPEVAREFLDTDESNGYIVIKRLITVDHSPFAWIQNILSRNRFPDLVERGLINNSVQQTLLDVYGVKAASSDHWIQVTKAGGEDVELLSVESESMILRLDTAFVDQFDNPMVFMCTRLITDQMRLHLRSSVPTEHVAPGIVETSSAQ